MRFVETTVFTRRATLLLVDEVYRELQLALLVRPDAGKVIVGSGGLRKIRWARDGNGTRGGLRVIYDWNPTTETFFMLFVYAKNEQEDLTPDQLRALKDLAKEQLR